MYLLEMKGKFKEELLEGKTFLNILAILMTCKSKRKSLQFFKKRKESVLKHPFPSLLLLVLISILPLHITLFRYP